MREFDHAFERYSIAIRNQTFQAAYDMADADFRTVTSYPQFASIHRAMNDKFGRLGAVKRTSQIFEGRGTPTDWFARTDATLQFERGTVKFGYWFHASSGKWMLRGFDRSSD
jgi:hypothetical protein